AVLAFVRSRLLVRAGGGTRAARAWRGAVLSGTLGLASLAGSLGGRGGLRALGLRRPRGAGGRRPLGGRSRRGRATGGRRLGLALTGNLGGIGLRSWLRGLAGRAHAPRELQQPSARGTRRLQGGATERAELEVILHRSATVGAPGDRV